MAPQGYLLVYSDPGEKVSEEEFTDWYDNEHVPLRVAVPAFLSWNRWEAADEKTPRWAATYDLTSYEATQQPPYTTLADTRSEREKRILANVGVLDRRTYEAYEGPPPPAPSALFDPATPAPYTVLVATDVKGGTEEDYNRWYDEEHIPMLAAVPGWVRSRRFVLKDWSQGGAVTEKKSPPKFLAVHEWQTLPDPKSKEYEAAMNTPWRAEIVKTWVSYERRFFKHHKSWDRNAL